MACAAIRVHWRLLIALVLAAGAIGVIGIEVKWPLDEMWREAGYNLTYVDALHKNAFIVLSPPILALVIVLLLAIGWRRCGVWDRPILVMLVLGIVAIWVASAASLPNLPGNPFLEGLAQRLTADDTINKIKLWASEHPGFEDRVRVQGLPRAYVQVSKDGSTATLIWGGAFFPVWGVTVSKDASGAQAPGSAYSVLQIEQGACVWMGPD